MRDRTTQRALSLAALAVTCAMLAVRYGLTGKLVFKFTRWFTSCLPSNLALQITAGLLIGICVVALAVLLRMIVPAVPLAILLYSAVQDILVGQPVPGGHMIIPLLASLMACWVISLPSIVMLYDRYGHWPTFSGINDGDSEPPTGTSPQEASITVASSPAPAASLSTTKPTDPDAPTMVLLAVLTPKKAYELRNGRKSRIPEAPEH